MKKDKGINRRNFIRASALGATGAFIGKNTIASPSQNTVYDNSKKIIYRTLGKTGYKVPIVGMGVMRADNPGLVRAAYSKGITHFDTAHGYQGGQNEEMLGKILPEYERNSFNIATKVNMRTKDKETGAYTSETDPKKFLEMLDLSLKRLNLDYVDFLYLHSVESAEGALYKPLLKALEKAKQQGKAKHVGLSTHRREAEVINAAVESGVYEVVLTAYNYRFEDDNEMQDALQNANEAGLGVIAMKTMTGGFFDKERQQPVDAKAALKWVLQNENIHTTIPGYKSFAEIDESFSVMEDLKMTPSENENLEQGKQLAGLYCKGCNECVSQCKKRLPIPDLMRAFMYTYGYHEYEKAQNVLLSHKRELASACGDCNICTVECPMRLNVAERIKDVSRLKDVPQEFFT